MKNKNALKVGIGAILIGISVAFMMMTLRQSSSEGYAAKAFFSVDDGTTWFADDASKPSGFIKDGKPAYSVNVYVKGSGKPFVGFLRKTGVIEVAAPPKPIAPKLPSLGGSVDQEKFAKRAVPSSVGTPAPVPQTDTAPATPSSAPESKAPSAAPNGMVDPRTVESLVKRPGDKEWYGVDSPKGRAILMEFGPKAQSEGLEQVMP